MQPEYSRGSVLIDGIKVVELIHNADSYAIYRVNGQRYAVYVSNELVKLWLEEKVISDSFYQKKFEKFEAGYLYISEQGYKLFSPMYGPYPDNWDETYDFCDAFKNFTQIVKKSKYSNLLYIEKHNLLLPLYSLEEKQEDIEVIIGKWLSAGLPIKANQIKQLKLACYWLDKAMLEELLQVAGIKAHVDSAMKESIASIGEKATVNLPSKRFTLPGREKIEKYFNEQIIDFLQNMEEYQRMGIENMPATIFYGEPGSGKTYAVQKLAEYLDLPLFEISSNSTASPFIHETSKKIAEVFKNAIEAAPSILIIDEMESYLSSRTGSNHEYHIEEVDEFLRNIPEAINAHVIIFAMTNHVEMIDPAVLRKGRFDQIIEVEMPSIEEILAVLKHSMCNLPVQERVNLNKVARKLLGRPLSDVTFIIREAGRLAVRAKSRLIMEEHIMQCVENLLVNDFKKEISRKIGFELE